MKNSVKINFVYNSLYQILTILLPLITTPYLSRVLGANGIGEYSYHFSIAKYFVLFAMLGLNNYGNRVIATVRDDYEKLCKAFSSIYIMQCVTSFVVLLVYMLYIIVSRQNLMAWVLLLYVISTVFDINWFFFGLEQFKLTVVRNTIIKLLSTAFVFIFVKEPTDVYIYGLILASSFISSQLVLWPIVKRYVKFVKPTIQDVLEHVKPNLVLFIPVIAVSLYKLMDKIMLGGLTNLNEVGYYENAEKIIDIPVVLVQALGTVMLPKMTNLITNKKEEEGNKYFYFSMILAIILSSSLSFGIMAIGKEFVPLFFGKGFDKCIALFLILAPSTIFIAIANVIRTQYLIPIHEDKVYIISVSLGAITNIIFNLLLIPYLQSVGAAIGTLLAEAVVCIYQIIKVYKKFDVVTPIIHSIPFLISSVIMCVFLLFWPLTLENPVLTITIKIFVGIVIYVFVAIVILFIRKCIFKQGFLFWKSSIFKETRGNNVNSQRKSK